MERFLAGFRDHLLEIPGAAPMLRFPQHGDRLRRQQKRHLHTLLGGRYGGTYARSRQRIGAAHRELGLDPAWLPTAYGCYMQELLELVRPCYAEAPGRYQALWRALGKIVLLDMSLVLEAFEPVDSRAIRERESRLRQVQRLASIGSWEWDPGARYLRFSAEAASLFGLPPSAERLAAQRALELVHTEDRAGLLATVERAQDEGLPFQLMHRIGPDSRGRVRYLKHYAEPVREGRGRLLVQGAVQDITDQYLAEQQLRRMAQHDPLTGLMNMSGAVGALETRLAEARQRGLPLAILMVGLDRMKRINDSLGRDVGDRLLRLAARRLQRAFPGHLVARVGGDEFLLVPRRCVEAPEALDEAASRAAALFDGSVRIAGQEMPVSISVGGIQATPGDRSARDLVRGVNSALYRAKSVGGRAWRLFDPALDAGRVRELGLEARLRRAIACDEFHLCYQPQYDMHRGQLVGLEALLRWASPEGVQFPDAFIGALEESGLMVAVGQLVLRQACRQLAAWQHAGIHVPRVAVNVSALQLADPGFLDFVAGILEETGIPHGSLELELTEHAVIRSPEEAGQRLRGLKALGIRVTMDDFGTGYSSLSYLKRLPVDQIKVDKSFVSDLPGDEGGAALTRAIIAMAHGLGLQVVAEGVETREQLAFLETQGCDMVQGFLLGRPVPAEQVPALARRIDLRPGDEVSPP